jgi:hypothetical protein
MRNSLFPARTRCERRAEWRLGRAQRIVELADPLGPLVAPIEEALCSSLVVQTTHSSQQIMQCADFSGSFGSPNLRNVGPAIRAGLQICRIDVPDARSPLALASFLDPFLKLIVVIRALRLLTRQNRRSVAIIHSDH